MISYQFVMARANDIYKERKECDMTKIQSDQVKAVAEALVEAVNFELRYIVDQLQQKSE